MNMSEGESEQTLHSPPTETQGAKGRTDRLMGVKTETLLVLKKVANFFKFPLDKPHKVWYNKDVPRGTKTKLRVAT